MWIRNTGKNSSDDGKFGAVGAAAAIKRQFSGGVGSATKAIFSNIYLRKSRRSLLERYGESVVRLSSANTYSYEKRDITFSTYCRDYMAPQRLTTLGNGQY